MMKLSVHGEQPMTDEDIEQIKNETAKYMTTVRLCIAGKSVDGRVNIKTRMTKFKFTVNP